MKITEKVVEIARPIAERNGCELWDVEFVKEGGDRYLRVFIDKPGGVSIDDCEAVSRELDSILDEADIIAESYIFEVSSAGLERPLKRPSDFEKFIGHKVYVSLYKQVDGRKEHTGILTGYDNGDVEIEIAGQKILFKKNDVALVRLSI